MDRVRHLLLVLFAGLVSLGAGGAQAAAGSDACGQLKGTGFAEILDAPTAIVSASYQEATAGRPAYCAIEGYVSPSEGFALWLPTGWNGRLLVRGCGGFCGIVAGEFACADPIRSGYACLQTDMGHKSTLTDGAWAYGNLQAKIDFAYRATHVTTLAGKAVAARYYGAPSRRNYFLGCSTGGRQGMVEAERYPRDFDGIVAIAPALDETGSALQLTWSVLANRSNGRNILSPDKVAMLHKAVIGACDLSDGLKDGLIGDPRQCTFKPADLACKAGDRPDCLTEAEIGVADKLYQGARDSAGSPLGHGGTVLGAEAQWVPSYVGTDDKIGSYAGMMQEFWRYLGFDQDPGPGWTLDRFDFDRDPTRIGGMESLYSGRNPDLRPFKAAGGKLLLAHGWGDESVVPGTSIDYYADATRFMGGPAATTEFFRLFMIPGMKHCTGGEGAYAIDYLSALEAWVEHGQAPERLVGAHPKDGVVVPYLGVGLALTPDQIGFKRPIDVWPNRAFYKGAGDPDDPATWETRAP